MTNQEAIAQLKEINREAHIYSEAVDMAIKALELQPSEDFISRAYIEPIIEELENICVNGDEHVLDLLADIKNAPSVTPHITPIVLADALMEERRKKDAPDKNVEDLISRAEAILQPESEYVFYDSDHGFCINTQDVLDYLRKELRNG